MPYPASQDLFHRAVRPVAESAGFHANALGTYGNLGRNAVRGPGTVNVDVALSRIFKFKERYGLQVRAEAFNVLNHTNFVGAISPAGQTAASPP